MPDVVAAVRFGPRQLSRAARVWSGSTVRVTLEFRDQDTGALTAVAGVGLAVTRPDSTVVTWTQASLTADGTGRYWLDVTPATLTQLGQYTFVATATAPQAESAAALLRVLAANDTTTGADAGSYNGTGLAASAAASAASAAVAAASIVQWINPGVPLPPQAFDSRAGDPTYTAQQSILSTWLTTLRDTGRAGVLPEGVYRLSGAQQVTEIVGQAVSIVGAGPGRSVIWMDDSFSGRALAFRDVWWGSDPAAVPAGVSPPGGLYNSLHPWYQQGQSWQGRLFLTGFSIIGTITNLATGALSANVGNQRGMDLLSRMDHHTLEHIHFGNIPGSAIRAIRGGTVQPTGLRECRLQSMHFRQCGWGAANPALDLFIDSTSGPSHNFTKFTGLAFANLHGTAIRLQQEGLGANNSRTLLFSDIMMHGEASWNSFNTSFDPSVPLPGGSRWHMLEILGAVSSCLFRGMQTTHSMEGFFLYHFAARNGAAPSDILIEGTNEPAGADLVWIEAGSDIRLAFAETSGGRIKVDAGVTGAIDIVPPPGEALNLEIAEGARTWVSVGNGRNGGELAWRMPKLDARVALSLGASAGFERRSVVLYARTLSATPLGNLAETPDGNLGTNFATGQAATPIRLDAGTMAAIVYSVVAQGATTARAEWRGVVLAHRVGAASTITLLSATAASALVPDSSALALGANARLAIATDTTRGGVTFAVTAAGTMNVTLQAEVLTQGQVDANNLAVVQALLERRAAPLVAGLLDLPATIFADDAAAGAGGLTTGQRYVVAGTGKVATKI